MTIRRRLRRVERKAGFGDDVLVPIVWDGKDEELWRERVEEADQNGWGINLIAFSVIDEADTVEQARTLITEHRESGDPLPITVYKRGSRADEVLAEWDPGLPDWLRAHEADE